MWIILYILLLDPEALSCYEINSLRRAALLKIQGRLGERELNQLPSLEPLSAWLSRLAVVNPQQGRAPPLVTTITQVNNIFKYLK